MILKNLTTQERNKKNKEVLSALEKWIGDNGLNISLNSTYGEVRSKRNKEVFSALEKWICDNGLDISLNSADGDEYRYNNDLTHGMALELDFIAVDGVATVFIDFSDSVSDNSSTFFTITPCKVDDCVVIAWKRFIELHDATANAIENRLLHSELKDIVSCTATDIHGVRRD